VSFRIYILRHRNIRSRGILVVRDDGTGVAVLEDIIIVDQGKNIKKQLKRRGYMLMQVYELDE